MTTTIANFVFNMQINDVIQKIEGALCVPDFYNLPNSGMTRSIKNNYESVFTNYEKQKSAEVHFYLD